MADLKLPIDDANPKPAAPPVTTRRFFPWAFVPILVLLGLNLALCIRRAGDDRGAIAFICFSQLNVLLLFGATRSFEISPPGSPARGRAKLALWLLLTTLTAGFTWKVGALLPLGFALVAWAMAAASVLGGFYAMFLLGEK